jgi:RHS repeat-associated protein
METKSEQPLDSAAFKFDSFIRSGVDPRTGSFSCSLALNTISVDAPDGAKVPLVFAYDSFNRRHSGLGAGWALRTCCYDQRRGKLTLSNGVTYRLRILNGKAIFEDKKLDNLKAQVRGDDLYIDHIDGTTEVLSRTNETSGEWLLTSLFTPEGHETAYSYRVISGRRQLTEVRDQRHRLLSIDYAVDGRQSPAITLWPDIPSKRLQYSLLRHNELLKHISLVTAENNVLTWSFEYKPISGFLVMTDVLQPSGLREVLVYKPDAHRLPTGAPMPSVPAVIQSTLSPGGGQLALVTRYEYSPRNFLGFDSRMSWTEDEDVLFRLNWAYEYSCTEIHMALVTGERREASRVVRTYNRFHSMVSQETSSDGKVHLRRIEHYEVPNKPFRDQPAQFQMPRAVSDSWYDRRNVGSDGQYRGREEVTRTVYDGHGNLMEKTGPSGVCEVYEFFPVQGDVDCPASPLGVPCFLKQKRVIASPGFVAAPTTMVRYTYVKLPSLRTDGGRCVKLASEVLHEEGVSEPRVDCHLEYINDIGDPFHGRLKRKVETVGGVPTVYGYRYVRENTNVRTDQVFSARGLSHLRQSWHDESGWLVKSQDASANSITMEYDSLGQLTRETVMPGTDSSASRQYTYRPYSAADPFITTVAQDSRGALTATRADGLGRKISVQKQDVDAPGAPMRLIYRAEYDSLGRLRADEQVDWFAGATKTLRSVYEYDAWGHQSRISRSGRAVVHDEIDPVALTRTQWMEGGCKTRTFNNIFGKPSRVERVDVTGVVLEVTSYNYDGLGRCVKQTASDAGVTLYSYDLAGRLLGTTLPDGTQVKKKYSAQSQGDFPIEISVNGYVVGSRDFDGLMRIVCTRTGGRVEQMIYEGASRNHSQKITAAGKVLNFTLNPLLDDCVIERKGSQAQVFTKHRYDPHTGLLQESANSTVQRRLEYFASGRIRHEIWMTSSNRYESSETYSLMGRPISHTDVNGTVRTCRYDETGRLSGITQGGVIVAYIYDAHGLLSSQTLTDVRSGVSVVTDLAYDEFGREILRRSLAQGNDVQELVQSFGPGDKLRQRVLKVGGVTVRSESFIYDLRGRLKHYACEGEQAPVDVQGKIIISQDFTYDSLDNIRQVFTRFAGGENIANYRYDLPDKTQLSAVSHSHPDYASAHATFRYDADGNLLNDSQGRSLSYDELGRLESVGSAGSGSVSGRYRYEPSDRLHAVESVGQKPCRRFYREDRLCSDVTEEDGRSIMSEAQQVLALLQGQETTLFRTDGCGNVLQAFSGDGNARHAYLPYGQRPLTDGFASLFGFGGESQDVQTGCYLLGNGYRAYDPVLMRFHRPDSWSPFDGGGLNPYAYCLGDPINLRDPTGHISSSGWIKIGLAVAFTIASVALTVATLGASAPLVGLSSSAAMALTLEVVSGAVSIASSVLDETAPDAVITQVLSYTNIALSAVSGGASLAGKVLGKGTSVALLKTVDSLGDVVTLGSSNASRVTRMGMYAKASSPIIRGGGQRNHVALKKRLEKVLTAKDVMGYAGYGAKGVMYTVERDKYIEKAKRHAQAAAEWLFDDLFDEWNEIYGDVRTRSARIRLA